MQGTLTVDRPAIRGFAVALLAAAVLILGALGGYWIRGVAAASTPVAHHIQSVASSATPAPMKVSGAAFDSGARRSGTQY